MASDELEIVLKGKDDSLGRSLEGASQDVGKLEKSVGELDQTLDNLEKGMGETVSELKKLNDEVNENGASEAADAFGNMERVLIGVNDNLGVLSEQFGISLGPMQEWVGAAANVAGGMEGIIGGGMALVQQFGPMVSGIIPLIASTWAYTTALLAQAAAFIVANAPLIAIIAGFALLAAGVLLVIKYWDEIVAVVPGLGAAFNALKSPIDSFKSAVDAAIGFVRDNWPLLAAIILAPFAPIILIATDMFGIRSKMEAGIRGALDFVKNNWPEIAVIISGPFAPLVLLATDAFGVRSALQDGFVAAKDFVKEQINGMVGFITGLPASITGAVESIKSAAKDIGTGIIDGIKDGISGLGDALSGLGGDLQTALKGAVNSALRWLHDNVRISIPGFDPPGPGPSIDGFTWSFPLMQFGSGGVVPGSGTTDSVPALLTPGELVLTREQTQGLMRAGVFSNARSGGQGNVVHVNVVMPNYLGSKSEVAREIYREIKRGGAGI